MDIAQVTAKKKSAFKKKWRIRFFIAVMLAYPVAHFSIFWIFVNVDAIMLAFSGYNLLTGNFVLSGFENFQAVFRDVFNHQTTQNVLINSFLFFPVTSFITVPLSLLFSYFLFKKMPMANAFRVIFFLPSIIPVVALTFAFRMSFSDHFGFVNNMLESMGLSRINWFGEAPYTQYIVFMYSIWAGLGFNIVLLSGAMGRVPLEVVESAQLDGITMRKEFTHIMIPLIWPTVVTLFVLSMTSVLTVFLQPLLLTGGGPNGRSSTISLEIFESVRGGTNVPYMAAFGLAMSLIIAPIIMLARFLLSKLWTGVDY